MSDRQVELASVLREVYESALEQEEDVFVALARYALALCQEAREDIAKLGDELSGIIMSGAAWAKLVRER